MDATQMINESILESDEEENKEESKKKRGNPLAKLCILKNEHIPETELPLFLGENVLGRDPNTCTLPVPSPSISKQHAIICISVYRRRGHSGTAMEALVWDLGSLNGTRKGRLKLTPHVRYALSECESLVLADIPCQYVSWAADTVSSQDDLKTPVSKSSGIEARLSEFLEEKESVNRAMKARVSLPDQEDMRKTPVRTICLSFAQTPAQPQGTLVPESDLDSDEDRGAGADRRHKSGVCDSDSYKSSPTCSTFLSPSTKIVPESEDESPITPSSFTKNRSHQHVSFSTEEIDVNVGRQRLKEKKALAIVDGSEEEEGREQERAALEGRQSEESGCNGPVNQENNVGLRREDELPASTTAVVTDEIPALHMDSDTDIEGEEEEVVASAVPVTLNANQQADNTSNTAQFLMDSDTDVEETADALDKVSDPVPSYDNTTKPLQVVPVIQPDGTAMDSDTDVDDDVSLDAASKAKPVLFQGTHTADSAPSTQPMHFYLDSDTDLDEEKEEKEKELVTRSDIKPVGPESATAAHHSLHMDSETDDEATTKACTTANTCADLEILSDSDTDVKDDFPEVIPSAVTPLSFTPATVSEAVQPDSDAGTDVDEPIVPPAGDIAKLGDPQVDSETDVEDEVDFGMAGEDHVPMLHRENTPRVLVLSLQNCSTPVQCSGQIEHMETQAFLSSCSSPFKCAADPSLDDENFAVAETQSFVLQAKHCQGSPSEGHVMEPTQAFGLESSGDDKSKVFSRGGSFQLGLSESSHMQDRVQSLATQAFVSVDDIQAYADRNFSESDSNMEATQAHGKDEESARGQVTPETEGKVDLALEATQAYISDSYCDSEDEPDDGKRNTATTENRPFNLPTSSTLAMAETQPLSAFKKDEILDKTNPVSSVPRPQNETEQRKDQLQTSFLTVAETQPMCASDDEESDDEDSFSGLQQRKTKPLQLEEEQTQPFTCCELSFAETQPMHISIDESMATSGNEASDEDNSVTLPQNRRAKTLKLGQEKTQTLTNSELSAAETQPMVKGENEESDEEDSIPGPRRRRPKALKLEEEETQTLTNSERSAVETQPMVKGEDGESDEVDTVTVTQKRNAKPLQIQENETKPLMNSEASTFKTQRPQRGKTGQDDVGTSGITTRGRRGTRATLREEPSECAEPPKRQTRGTNKAYTTTRGRTGKSRPDEGDKEKEKVEQTKQAKEKRSIMQQNEEEKDNHDKNVQEEGRLGEEEDATVLRQQEGEKTEKESRETDKRQREQEESQQRREEEKKLERERKEKEEQEKMQAENAERLRLECERAKKETMERARKERKEKETAERIRKDKEEQLEREQKGKEDKERLELEKVEREEKARIENQRKEQEEKEKVEVEELLKRQREEQETNAKLESEAKAREQGESFEKEKQEIKEQQQNMSKVPSRGWRAGRRTTAVLRTAEPEQDSTISAKDDVPARRTRSRSNSSNSVSSERSTSSVLTHESKGRGRSRGANRRTSEPPAAVMARSSNRRKTELTERNSNDVSRGVLSRSNSSNSLNSERRGGRQRERGRKTEADSVPPVISQRDPKPTARDRKNNKAEESSHGDDTEKAESLQVTTTRGQLRSSSNGSESANGEDPSKPEGRCVNKDSLPLKMNIRGQKAVKSETPAASVSPGVSNGYGAKEKRKGRKRELEANTEDDSSTSSKISKGKEMEQTTEAAEGDTKDQTKDEIPVRANRRGRSSIVQTKNKSNHSPTEVVKEDGERMVEEAIGKRGRDRHSVQKKKKEEQNEIGTSVDQRTLVVESEPQTPTSRKRQAAVVSSPAAKTPRSSSASPAAGGRSRAATQTYKVLFTGVVDEAGERVLTRLGGSLAKGVADMNCLVTDKVRRTVKFLCAVAKGVPVVTTQWLEKCGKAGVFLSPSSFIVKDLEQENKFNFCLQESVKVASNQPLLQGYEIHVTKSVKPEPVQMKDILTCSGATFLPKMPSFHKPQTVVISCEEDWLLCGVASSASIPVVTAEFILTGILQQKLDFQTHALPAPAINPQPAGGRGRSRKKT